MAIQDAWIGEIADFLDRDGQLGNTIILVTGDHGIRTRREDPSFHGGTIEDYSFHVPMRLFAPRALSHTERIPWFTSHIDVTPTLLDLLGVDRNRASEQGVAIWNPALKQRTIFFLANEMFNADGLYDDGKFFMWSRLSGDASANSAMSFGPGDVLPNGSSQSKEIISRIERLNALSKAWSVQFNRR